jgi:hypothetical protein
VSSPEGMCGISRSKRGQNRPILTLREESPAFSGGPEFSPENLTQMRMRNLNVLNDLQFFGHDSHTPLPPMGEGVRMVRKNRVGTRAGKAAAGRAEPERRSVTGTQFGLWSFGLQTASRTAQDAL